jgi:hypothetical protein
VRNRLEVSVEFEMERLEDIVALTLYPHVPRAKELDRSAVQTDGGYLIRLSLIVGWYGGVAGGRS